ncbi:MAG: hypothetical protein IPI49_03365 [Myxococcales bacterium]|nr:hypothetical protein [Myxococcales bacterium]
MPSLCEPAVFLVTTSAGRTASFAARPTRGALGCGALLARLARFALLALLALLVGACGGASNSRISALAEALPATLEPASMATGEPRVVKVRVWADAEARLQPKWRDQILEQIDAASQFWTPLFGIRIEVVGVRSWERKSEGLAALAELRQLDAGTDVAWVLGYLGPYGRSSIALSELGFAELLGRHLLVRDWSPVPELGKLRDELEGLSEPERAEVISAHRRHKQTVVLLHYLHLSAGAVAESDEAWIGSRGYAPSVRTVSERTRQLLAVSLQSRLDDEDPGTAAARLIDEIERADGPGWVAADRDDIVAQLKGIVERSLVGKVAQDVPRAAAEQYERARALVKSGKATEALGELEPLLVAYPSNAALHQLRCEIMLAKPGVSDPATQSACQRASELAPGDPRPDIAVARAHLAAGARDQVRVRLLAATDKARAMAMPAQVAESIAEIYRSMGALTWTEEALGLVPPAPGQAASPSAQWAAGTRARYGVPRGATFVRPEQEGELVAAIRAGLDAVYADKYAEADKHLAGASKRWPQAPGIAAVRCDLALRREQLAEARRQCALSLRGDDGQSWAHYLSGILALRGQGAADTGRGVTHLRRAIAIDPDLAQAWRALGKALERAKDQAGLAQVRADYQARFGQVLP